MSAYKIPRQELCCRFQCYRDAAFEVFNGRNATLGMFCQKHADEEIAAQDDLTGEAP